MKKKKLKKGQSRLSLEARAGNNEHWSSIYQAALFVALFLSLFWFLLKHTVLFLLYHNAKQSAECKAESRVQSA